MIDTQLTIEDKITNTTTETLFGEQWRKIPNFNNYLVSNYGRLYSHARTRTGRIKGVLYNVRDKILTPSTDAIGYKHLRLTSDDGKIKLWKLHRLVYLAFNLWEIPQGLEIDHINSVKDDCRLDNLQAVTHQENVSKSLALDWSYIYRGEKISFNNLAGYVRDWNTQFVEDKLTITSMASLFYGRINEYKGFQTINGDK